MLEAAEDTPIKEGAVSYLRVDHIAFAVRDLDRAVEFFESVLGFTVCRRLETRGKKSGMVSAELEHNGIKFVLCQGTEPESQVSQLVTHYGPGVAHIALAVDNIESTVTALKEKGLKYDTSIIDGGALKQAFSSRDANTGLSFEFIERSGEEGFLPENVQSLFDQLESSGAF